MQNCDDRILQCRVFIRDRDSTGILSKTCIRLKCSGRLVSGARLDHDGPLVTDNQFAKV